MSFPFLRSVAAPPAAQVLHHEQILQPFVFPPSQFFGPANPHGKNKGNSRGRGWSRKLPNANNCNNVLNYKPVGNSGAKWKKPTCDTCDRHFASPQELSEHISQHQTCGQEGCTFSAHPKVVAKHIEVQHKTGLYARMKKEADQWIEERKKKYPSKDNIIKKIQERTEKIERGEKITEQNSRFGSKGRGCGWKKGKRQHPYKQTSPQTQQSLPLIAKLSDAINSEKIETNSSLPDVETQIGIASPLVSIINHYNSEDSDTDSPPEEVPLSREPSGPPPPMPAPLTEKKLNPRHAQLKQMKSTVNPREQFKKRNRPPTLLHKLLVAEICRERNKLLQCVHFLVQNNLLK